MVLLREEGPRRRGKELPQVWDLSHDVDSTKSSLEEESAEAPGQDLHFSSDLAQHRLVSPPPPPLTPRQTFFFT